MDDPQVVVYVVVDEPNVPEQADSTYPQVLFRKIATELFPYLGLYPTEAVDPQMLAYLGITEDDIVQGGRAAAQTFDCFDSSGRYYSDAYVNQDMVAVDGNGNPLDGVTVNAEEGTVTDAKGNVKQVDLGRDENIDPVADNPDVAAPPAEGSQEEAAWAGVTDEDLAPAGDGAQQEAAP